MFWSWSAVPTLTRAGIKRPGFLFRLPGGGKCSITIEGNSLHYRNSAGWFKTTFTLPAGAGPRQLHATIKECSPPSKDAIGKVVFAIFKIEGGTLTLAEFDGSDKPPESFDSAASRYIVKKVQPQKKKAEASTSK